MSDWDGARAYLKALADTGSIYRALDAARMSPATLGRLRADSVFRHEESLVIDEIEVRLQVRVEDAVETAKRVGSVRRAAEMHGVPWRRVEEAIRGG